MPASWATPGRAAGQPDETLVRERICLPLGMPDTVVTPTGEQTARLATGHTRRRRPVAPFQLPALPGAGALRLTATDLLGLLRANLDPALPRWPPSWSAPSFPGSGQPSGWRSGSAG